MTNNDILRRLRYTFDFNDSQMISIFASAEHKVSRENVSSWLKQDTDEGYEACTDANLALFLDGLINEKRGKKEGAPRAPETKINHNIVFRKLKIALNLQAEEVLEILALADFRISKHELSALFRNPEHRHYRECQDQVLRNFLHGMQIRYRENA